QPFETDPSMLPSSRTMSVDPTGRGAELRVATTVATAAFRCAVSMRLNLAARTRQTGPRLGARHLDTARSDRCIPKTTHGAAHSVTDASVPATSRCLAPGRCASGHGRRARRSPSAAEIRLAEILVL